MDGSAKVPAAMDKRITFGSAKLNMRIMWRREMTGAYGLLRGPNWSAVSALSCSSASKSGRACQLGRVVEDRSGVETSFPSRTTGMKMSLTDKINAAGC